ncbi:MAG: long-chain fatty acid--CoA ligase [Bacteroidales bacterium]|nr:long-chain fatty acid--CoA ligase [Bacteroidales bacterium]
MEIKRIFDLLDNLTEKFPDLEDILAKKRDGKWIKYSVRKYVADSHSVAYGLLALGYGKETKVITISDNRPEWNCIDMGTAMAGMIHVPTYPTLSHDEFLHVFNHSDAELIFVGNANLYKKVAPIVAEMEKPAKIIMIDPSDEVFSYDQLKMLGNERSAEFAPIIEKNKKEISEDDCVTMIYTSGTTGLQKGVMLSHHNLLFSTYGHVKRQVHNQNHKWISFLPLCHCYERTMIYEYQWLGIRTYYAESIATFAADLADCHGDGFCAVPRVLEVMYGKFEAAGKNLKGVAKYIYKWAWDLANNYDYYNKNKFYLAKLSIADKLVYSKWRNNLGGHELIVVSGGSSIQAKIVRCFNAAKLRIYEGYGMTETSPVIAVNSPKDGINIIGTVGKPLDDSIVKIADDGEILVKGPHVMLGYYKSPEQTKEVIDEDGFLHTGDIGFLQEGKYLKITDRKKEIFKLSNGKYIAPQVIETMLKETSYFENCFVFGSNEKFASAILIPNSEKLKDFASKHKIAYKKIDELLQNDDVVKFLHQQVQTVNDKLAAHEQIKREQFIIDEWSPLNGLLSQTLKPKRAKIQKKYEDIIAKIYE